MPSVSLPAFGPLARIIYWVAIVLLAAYLAIRYRSQIARAISDFMAALRRWLNQLFGRKASPSLDATEQLAEGPPPKPFSDFANPFTSGLADRASLDALIRYSFEAFEAWGRERGCPRGLEQTPFEFARLASRGAGELAPEAAKLAELYSWSAYGREQVPSSGRAVLQRFWSQLAEA